MKKKFALLLLPLLLLFGCSKNVQTPMASTDKPVVYASVYPVYDFTQKIGGDKIDVICLVPAGSDAHDFEPSARDIADLQKADAFFYNGLGMESFLSNLESNADIPFYQIADETDLLEMEDDHGHGEEDHKDEEEVTDPHVWLSPLRAKGELLNIKNALIEIDPGNQEYYEENYQAYAAKCDELDQLFEGLNNQSFVMTHNAYSYLSHDYGFTVYAVDNDGNADPSAARIKEIVEYCRKNNIKDIYYEMSGSDKIAKTIAAEAGLTVRPLNSFESLVDGNSDYFEVMQQNYRELKGE